MKKTFLLMSLLVALFTGFTSCSSSDDDEDKGGKVMTDKTSITFMSKQGVSETLSIVASKEWTVSGMPEWLNASSTSGRGNSTILLTTKTANNTVEERTAQLTVQSGNNVAYVTVIQETSLAAGCTVKPTDIVTLATGTAFDYSYGNNVAYLYSGILEKTVADRYTEDEIIAELTKDKDDRITPDDNIVSSMIGMQPLTNYVIFTIGYDKNGDRGELVRTEIKTKNGRNQAVAEISDVRYTETLWKWQTTPDGYTERYYQWFIENENLLYASDPAVAWFFNKAMKSNKDDSNFAPIVKAQGWQRKRSGNTFHLMTWAKNVDGEFSGVIDRWMSQVSSAKDNGGIKLMPYKAPAGAKHQLFRKSDYKEVK